MADVSIKVINKRSALMANMCTSRSISTRHTSPRLYMITVVTTADLTLFVFLLTLAVRNWSPRLTLMETLPPTTLVRDLVCTSPSSLPTLAMRKLASSAPHVHDKCPSKGGTRRYMIRGNKFGYVLNIRRPS